MAAKDSGDKKRKTSSQPDPDRKRMVESYPLTTKQDWIDKAKEEGSFIVEYKVDSHDGSMFPVKLGTKLGDIFIKVWEFRHRWMRIYYLEELAALSYDNSR